MKVLKVLKVFHVKLSPPIVCIVPRETYVMSNTLLKYHKYCFTWNAIITSGG